MPLVEICNICGRDLNNHGFKCYICEDTYSDCQDGIECPDCGKTVCLGCYAENKEVCQSCADA